MEFDGLRLQLIQKQKLSMTAAMQQMFRLLQLSSVELHQEIATMLEHCVFLEIEETDEGYSHQTVGKVSTYDFDTLPAFPETLHEHLISQLCFLALTPIEHVVAEVLIDSIDEKGYLQIVPQDVVSILDNDAIDTTTVLDILGKIQAFEPAGVAARTQQECLSIQLERKAIDRSIKCSAFLLIEKCFSDLPNCDLSLLKTKTGLLQEEIESALNVIRSLNPFPGWTIDSSHTNFCIPDVIVEKKSGVWQACINREVSPVVRVNACYKHAIHALKCNAQSDLWRTQLREAQGFVRGLNNRYSTLLQVMQLLLEKQIGFFEYGDVGMKVLTMRSVAVELGLHESTISRTVQNKYVQTPRGLIAMKHFFSANVRSKGARSIASVALRAHIREFIECEDPLKPLSDTKLQERLATIGIKIARRTVAKYREGLGFFPSKQRRNRLGK